MENSNGKSYGENSICFGMAMAWRWVRAEEWEWEWEWEWDVCKQ